MNNPLSKTPFLFLLVPVVLGIVLQYYNADIIWSIIAFTLGGAIVLFSYFIKKEKQFGFRWLFALGAFFLFLSIGSGTTLVKQQSLNYTLKAGEQTYVGYVTDIPQQKPRSVAHKVRLVQENVDVVLYLQRDSTKKTLQVGDEIAFAAELQAFENMGNPDDFDYKQYMYNQGFVASAYLSSASWMRTGDTHSSVLLFALNIRQQILDFYTSLGFSADEHAILSALTLGYQDTLSDDLKEGFRTTGTVHILSVSGLHVGIIYAIISFLLSFIPRASRFYRFRPLLIIILLWAYAFVTGLPPSVIRASMMLSVFCLSEIVNRKSNSLNTLYVAAFVMLVANPFWLFDIGFQLSYVSVFSILVLHKRMVDLLEIKNKFGRYIWQMFAISVVAQLATFPICLYYFGTFPTYFFLANLVIVPLVSIIVAGVGLLIVAYGIGSLFSLSSEMVCYFPMKFVQFFVKLMTYSVELFQDLPFALIEQVNLTFTALCLLISTIILLLVAGIKNSSKTLIVAFLLTIVFLFVEIKEARTTEMDQLIVYNRNGYSDISLTQHGASYSLTDSISHSLNPVYIIGEKTILFLNNNVKSSFGADEHYKVDYCILVGDENYSMTNIADRYDVATMVVDASSSRTLRSRLTKECENRNILLHDVTKKGAFSIIF